MLKRYQHTAAAFEYMAVIQKLILSVGGRLKELLEMEKDFGLDRKETYQNFSSEVIKIRNDIRTFFVQCHSQNKKVAAYGAAAKGNTLLNFCGIDRSDLIAVFDGAEAKQGKLMPGSHIPIVAPDELANIDPDVLVILPWNLQQELVEMLRKRPWLQRGNSNLVTPKNADIV